MRSETKTKGVVSIQMKQRRTNWLLEFCSGIIIFFSCGSVVVAGVDEKALGLFSDSSNSYVVPPNIGDGLDSGHLADVGMDLEKIVSLIDNLKTGVYPNIHSLLIIKDDQLVVEAYFPGRNSSGKRINYDRNTLHELHSVTKSFNSSLIGIAMDKTSVFDVDTPVYELYPQYAELFNSPAKRQIRLRHMLSMTSGFSWDEWTYPYTDSRNDHVKLSNSSDPIRFLLSLPMGSVPGEQFLYNSGVSIALGGILPTVASKKADAYAEQFLFGPLGITNYDWYQYPSGAVQTGGGLSLRPRDMAKFGYLFLSGGKWGDDQVVPESWVFESTNVQAPDTFNPYEYGYQWWVRKLFINGKIESVVSADGRGGQFIFIVPSLDLVAVFTGWNDDARWIRPLALLKSFIVPAAVSKSSEILSGAGYAPDEWSDLIHPSGEHYNQILLMGESMTLIAKETQTTRLLYEDLNNDVVCVEFSGEGSLSIRFENVPNTLLRSPIKYKGLKRYRQGHARLSIEGATEETYLSVYALGPSNGEDLSVFPANEVYDGRADLKSIRITGTGMGGLYLGNAHFSGSNGLVGIDASGVPIHGRVAIGGISATGSGEPAILLGEGSTLAWDDGAVLVASSGLEQPNGSSIWISGFSSALSVASRDSNGSVLPARAIEAGFENSQGETVDIAMSLDADQSEANLSAPFVSELLGSGFGGSPQLDLVADQTYGDQAIALLTAAPRSRVPLQLSVASGHACIDGDTLALTGAGEVVVRATLPKTVFSDAVSVERSFEVLEIPDPHGDPDGDGIASLAETALGMDANVPDREALPAFSKEGSNLLVSFKRNRTDFHYVVEASEDLETWSSEGVDLQEAEMGQLSRAHIRLSPTMPVFMRLRIQRER